MSPAFAPVVPAASEPLLRSIVQKFLEENAQINLSAFRTEETCWIGNVLDSVAALDFIHELSASSSSIPRPLPPQEEGGRLLESKEYGWKKKLTPGNTLFFARSMRKEPTEAESLLWNHIRFDHLGMRFRRQYPLDGHILDFFAPTIRLAIEVDGCIHDTPVQNKEDIDRDSFFLQEHGIETIRFTNDEVIGNMPAVLNRIQEHIQKHSPSLVERGLGGEELRILDLGTGGGFPLLALAACMPEATFTGLDSVRKKVDAVTRVVDATGLANVKLVCGRAEETGRKGPYRAKYDVVTSRAVGPLAVLLELSAPLLKVGGYALCWKSLQINEELAASTTAQQKLHCPLIDTIRYVLPGDFGERQILVFRKEAATSGTYPRAVGVPGKFPLI